MVTENGSDDRRSEKDSKEDCAERIVPTRGPTEPLDPHDEMLPTYLTS
jgi:hypothetical protein